MARLTNRPSIAYSAASRYPSATPDPAFDQENMDPEQQPRDKGKQRAGYPSAQSRLPTPQSRDETSPSRGQKRKRVIVPMPVEGQEEQRQDGAEGAESDGDAQFKKDYDPHQNPEERREIKRRQRELVQDFHDSRDELLRDNGTLLQETVLNADRLFKQVKTTSDAVPDARLLVSVGQLAYKKSAALMHGDHSLGLDVDDFLSKCLSYLRNAGATTSSPSTQRRRTTTQADDDSDDDVDVRPLDWQLLGQRVCYRHNSRPPVPSFLLGPLSREKKQRAPTQRRARQEANTTQTARPEELTQLENEQADQNSVTTQCTRLHGLLEAHLKKAKLDYRARGFTKADWSQGKGIDVFAEHDVKFVQGTNNQVGGVPLFKWITNPHSFSQTVENLFYVSFLIKEGSIGIDYDDDGLPIIYPEKPHTVEQQRTQQITKQQAVLSLDDQTYNMFIEAYNIKEPMMPHRDDSGVTQMTNGWYAS